MSRLPAATDFHVSVEGIGTFSFGKRTMRDELRIAAEFSRLTEGVDSPTPFLATVAGWISQLRVLTVSAPDGWDLDALDPLDSDSYAKLLKVHGALREKEGSFRRGKNAAGESDSASALANAGVLVPPEVQPRAE